MSATASEGWKLTAQGANGTTVSPGATVDLNNADGNLVVSKTAANNDVTFNLAPNIALTSVTTGNAKLDTSGLIIQGGPSVTTSGINAAGAKISNVQAGTASTDAVNVSQLNAVVASGETHYYSVNDGGTQGGNFANDGATGLNAIAAGVGASASGAGSVVMGSGASDHGNANATIVGDGASIAAGVTGSNVALGQGSSVTSAAVSTSNAIIDGQSYSFAGATPEGVVSVGASGVTRQITNVAAGQLSAASTDAVNGSQLYATNQAIQAANSMASEGWNLQAQGANGTNVAPGATVNLTNSDGNVVISKTTANNDVTFNLAPNLTLSSVTTGNTTLNTNGLSILNGPSVTTSGIDAAGAKIIGVAAGTASTDAVNLAQLNAAVASTETHYYSVNDGGTQGGNFANNGATGLNALAAGVGAQAESSGAVAIGSQAQVSVAGGVAIGEGSVSDRPIAPAQGTIPNGGTHAIPFNTSDETLLGAVSFGSATGASYRQLTNVADGTAQQDAVTIRQLAGALDSFAVTGTEYFHVNSTLADSLAIGSQSVAVGPTTVVNGDFGVGIGDGAIVDSTAPGGVGIGEDAHAAQADAIAIGSGSTASGAQSIASGANAHASGAASLALGSGAQSSAADALAIGAGANASFVNSIALGAGSATLVGPLANYTAFGLSGQQTSSGELNIGNRQITGLAAGATAGDAVNVAQLQAVQAQLAQQIADINAGGNSGGNGTPMFVANTSTTSATPAATGKGAAAGGAGAVASGADSTAIGSGSQASAAGSTAIGNAAVSTGANSIALGASSRDDGRANVVSVGSDGSDRQISHVAAGTQADDAVNVSQLNASLAQANAYTDQRFNQVQQGITDLARNAYSGIAAATAMTMIPEADAGKTMSIGIGTGGYRGYQAVALGGNARINPNLKLKAGMSVTSGGLVFGVGAGVQW
ncbi:YadA-like family protein [Caballeronia sp. BR00000012568055]|uniref:YadA family autotransporter adhesin n=1 Tax=Caballeronia sp. BR00000012568055 TaxID=2918761 RepID=UPI0023F94DC2